jgi:hypothetical protein
MVFYHGAVFDERPPWHPGVLWWFFCVFLFIKRDAQLIRRIEGMKINL